jgi:2-C-methyl-D-erythritol 4-phosphate cytidylyltransferase
MRMGDTLSRTGAIIVGAGDSKRMGVDKVLLSLAGKPLLAWSVDICQSCGLIDQIVIVLNEDSIYLGRDLARKRGWSKVVEVCLGGKRRQDSVRQGLKELWDCEWVVVHDCARPFLTPELIHDGLEAAQETGSAAAAVPVKDTIKLGDNHGMVVETLRRQQLWAVQTPQVFQFDIITKAHEQVVDEVTDDASLAEHLGYKVKLYAGSYDNIKVTTPEDLVFAEAIAKGRSG